MIFSNALLLINNCNLWKLSVEPHCLLKGVQTAQHTFRYLNQSVLLEIPLFPNIS